MQVGCTKVTLPESNLLLRLQRTSNYDVPRKQATYLR